MFATVLHNLKSPENIGMIVRTHVAFGGQDLVFIGSKPWEIKKRAQAFSRRLEKLCRIIDIPNDDAFFEWCSDKKYQPVAIEITQPVEYLGNVTFPSQPAIIVGSEGQGLTSEFLEKCDSVLTIPQFGPVACLNVAVSCSIALYEYNRSRSVTRAIHGHKFLVESAEMPEGFEKCLPPTPKHGTPDNKAY
jgi:23S rRNA (guanosine2251-2'-O)-methyltransferase